jgi:CheY-like chemotaxis protein
MAEAMPTVLVVDDEEEVREYAAAVFEDLGLAVLRAASGEEALQILERHPEVRVLFSDVRMPGIGGAELAARAHRRWPALRVVLTSGYVGGVAIDDVEFLPKPYRPRDLRRKILPGLDDRKP